MHLRAYRERSYHAPSMTVTGTASPAPGGPTAGLLANAQRSLAATITPAQLRADVEALAAAPRETGTPGYRRAVDYAATQLRQAGWDVHVEVGRPFGTGAPRPGELSLQNVVAERAGTAPPADRKLVVLGAHLDSVKGGPGGNDNGSGVAAMLSIARAIGSSNVQTDNDLRIVLFDGEEQGRLGSSLHVRMNRDDLKSRAVGMLNADMIASAKGTFGFCLAPTSPSSITDAVTAAAGAIGATPVARLERHGRSDHESFAEAGVPSVNFGVSVQHIFGEDPNYHRSQDVAGNTNPELHDRFAGLIGAAALQLAGITSVD